jgi:Fe-S-cluster formation regulator IscX/YfhJ
MMNTNNINKEVKTQNIKIDPKEVKTPNIKIDPKEVRFRHASLYMF